jgi:hypothetical protein
MKYTPELFESPNSDWFKVMLSELLPFTILNIRSLKVSKSTW